MRATDALFWRSKNNFAKIVDPRHFREDAMLLLRLPLRYIAVSVVGEGGCQKARPEKALVTTICGGSIKLEATQETSKISQ